MEHLPAADAEHDLLPEALFRVSHVEPGRYAPVFGVVAGDVRIEEVKRDPADLDLPDGGVDGRVDTRDPDHQVSSCRVKNPGDGRRIAVDRLGNAFLPAIRGDVLVEVALRVHEPDGNHREAEVACFF